ncbi:MAG: GWxTD domain-containing protein [Crocinitomicaceae bacterium]|jgi:GWxTD domain-containing protein|nr:GWxTD domain-containing protein [Crocinitomicaceae bacterium]MDP4761626.1 GWxTD domain-containing protein [Crocinitomicaceae bacterium]
MKNTILILFCFLQSFSYSQGSKLKTYIDTKQFYAPGIGNYLEVYMQFVSYSVLYKNEGNGLRSKVLISVEIADTTQTVFSDRYVLESPEAIDSIQDDFYEVLRIQLNPGKYTMKLNLLDVNKEGSEISGNLPITIEDFSKNTKISDIIVAEFAYPSDEQTNFDKSGYHIIPMLSSFYATDSKNLPIYLELYGTEEIMDSTFLLSYRMINTKDATEMQGFSKTFSYKKGPVIPVFESINIEDLSTGNYQLEVRVSRSSNEILAVQTYDFERSNENNSMFTMENLQLDPAFQTSIPTDSVLYFLESLIPISKPAEIKNIIETLKSKNVENARKHLQGYWVITSPTNSYESWLKYKAQVVFVQDIYGNNFQEGFETDRGRVYLKYGAPNQVNARESSPSEYPYEIWTYNKIGIYSNKRFIFYNPDLVNNAYRLLHSDMLGELKNPAWPQILAKRNTYNGNVDDPNQNNVNHWGGESNDLFRQY